MDDGPRYDVAIVGGGIVGLAAARSILARHPGRRLVVLEKEPVLAAHQTGRNSGVIHSGIYYVPGSLKARLCVRGGRLLAEFCARHGIERLACGKVIAAVRDGERGRLDALYERGLANGAAGVERIGAGRLKELEPRVRGVAAVYLPRVCVVDFGRVARALAGEAQKTGADVRTGTRLFGAVRRGGEWALETTGGTVHSRFLVNCAGLHVDRVGRLSGDRPPVRIVPFRGEYYTLREGREDLVNGLVYPVPDPSMPFLGVHFTKTLEGGVHVGPSAVLALKREGYRRRDISWRDCLDLAASPAFWKMAARYWKTGMEEMARSFSRDAFLAAARRLVPDIRREDLVPSPSGVRAQAVDAEGTLLHDFVLKRTEHALHVYNAPSPAATASLAIGEQIAQSIPD